LIRAGGEEHLARPAPGRQGGRPRASRSLLLPPRSGR
jgi:hypothetical protein